MAKIGIFIAFKTERRFSNLLFFLHLISFLLGVIHDCLLNERLEEAHNLLTVGAQEIRRDRLNDDTVDDLDQPLTDQILHMFEGCCSSLFVYRALVLFKTAAHITTPRTIVSSAMKKNARLFLESVSVLVITYYFKANSKIQSVG